MTNLLTSGAALCLFYTKSFVISAFLRRVCLLVVYGATVRIFFESFLEEWHSITHIVLSYCIMYGVCNAFLWSVCVCLLMDSNGAVTDLRNNIGI